MTKNLHPKFAREWIRTRAQERVDTGIDDALEFYDAAIELGIEAGEADAIATALNERVMRAAGVI